MNNNIFTDVLQSLEGEVHGSAKRVGHKLPLKCILNVIWKNRKDTIFLSFSRDDLKLFIGLFFQKF